MNNGQNDNSNIYNNMSNQYSSNINQNNNGYQNDTNTNASYDKINESAKNSKKNNYLIFIIIIEVIMIAIVLIILLPKKNQTNANNNESSSGNEKAVTIEELKKNISITSQKTIKNALILFIKNNNDVTVSVSFDFVPYDASNNKIYVHDLDDETIQEMDSKSVSKVVLEAGEETIEKIMLDPIFPGYDHYELENYEVKVTKGMDSENKNIKIVSDQIIKVNGVDELQVKIENISSNTIDDVNIDVLYYVNDIPLDVEKTSFSSMNGGKSEYKNFLIPSDENAKKIELSLLTWYIYVHAYSHE